MSEKIDYSQFFKLLEGSELFSSLKEIMSSLNSLLKNPLYQQHLTSIWKSFDNFSSILLNLSNIINNNAVALKMNSIVMERQSRMLEAVLERIGVLEKEILNKEEKKLIDEMIGKLVKNLPVNFSLETSSEIKEKSVEEAPSEQSEIKEKSIEEAPSE